MNLLKSLNILSKTLLGVGVIDAWQRALQTKEASQKAQRYAQNKHLRAAITVAEKAIAAWPHHPSFWERVVCRFFLGKLLEQLTAQLQQWRKKVIEADKLASSAKSLVRKDTGDPLDTQHLSGAIALYKHCTKINCDDRISQALNQCEQEVLRRQQFQVLVKQASSLLQERFFKQAIAIYHEAEQLYSTEVVKQAIATYETQVKQEEIYVCLLQRVEQATKLGRLRAAITLLEFALTNFFRRDGTELLEHLQNLVKGREKFQAGLYAEQASNFQEATSLYETAKFLLPDQTGCQIRLGLIAIKTKDWIKALSYLEGVPGEQAAYIRGFCYAQQENLQQADQEWQTLSTPAIASQREILKNLSQRQRLLAIQNIEQLVRAEDLEKAKIASTEFIQKIGLDPLVEGNLKEYIQPRLAAMIWQGVDWVIIANTAQQAWISQPNITTLHNWVVACYYCSKSDIEEKKLLVALNNEIVALSTALANLTYDPVLQNLPWLVNQVVDYESVSLELKRRLSEMIDVFKDKNISNYLDLRDRYRLELVSLKLMESSNWGMKVKDVLITPGCYNRYINQWKDIIQEKIDPSQKILQALYTPWGLAVAACVDGDTQRAIQLKPKTKSISNAELFAERFFAYYEGSYHLQQQKWRLATASLKLAKSEINASSDWSQEIDKLSCKQRQNISDFSQHLEFAQFWYEIQVSPASKNYLAECKAEVLREQLANEQISQEKALQELQAIKRIDEQNPIVLDLIEKIEFNQELEKIRVLFQNNQYQEVVRIAKYSHNQQLKFNTAEIFIKILIDIANRGDARDHESIQQLGRWAYEICPHEPAFKEIYHSLRIY